MWIDAKMYKNDLDSFLFCELSLFNQHFSCAGGAGLCKPASQVKGAAYLVTTSKVPVTTSKK